MPRISGNFDFLTGFAGVAFTGGGCSKSVDGHGADAIGPEPTSLSVGSSGGTGAACGGCTGAGFGGVAGGGSGAMGSIKYSAGGSRAGGVAGVGGAAAGGSM